MMLNFIADRISVVSYCDSLIKRTLPISMARQTSLYSVLPWIVQARSVFGIQMPVGNSSYTVRSFLTSLPRIVSWLYLPGSGHSLGPGFDQIYHDPVKCFCGILALSKYLKYMVSSCSERWQLSSLMPCPKCVSHRWMLDVFCCLCSCLQSLQDFQCFFSHVGVCVGKCLMLLKIRVSIGLLSSQICISSDL